MIGVSDILKLLDQIPVWKSLKALPARIDELEKRLDALENERKSPSVMPGQPCPSCGAPALRRTSSVISHTPFGELGARDEVWTCSSCGETDERIAVR